MGAPITGTFSGTGQSAVCYGKTIDIAMNFAGTASVDVERRMPDGDWIKIETGITADYNEVAEYPSPVALRLNCTAYTNDVEYVMQNGLGD
jgi:hypothetical protein